MPLGLDRHCLTGNNADWLANRGYWQGTEHTDFMGRIELILLTDFWPLKQIPLNLSTAQNVSKLNQLRAVRGGRVQQRAEGKDGQRLLLQGLRHEVRRGAAGRGGVRKPGLGPSEQHESLQGG